MAMVEPSPATYEVTPELLEQMPAEMRAAFEALIGDEEVRKRRKLSEDALAYQEAEASVVLGRGGWVEVECDPAAAERSIEQEYWEAYNRDRIWAHLQADAIHAGPAHLDGQPTVHQFYKDLYCLPSLGIDDFYNVGYPGDDGSPLGLLREEDGILVAHRERDGHPYQLYRNYPEFVEAVSREQSFIYMGRFWQPTRKKDGRKFLIAKRNAMVSIGGFCVDIDRFEGDGGDFYPARVMAANVMDAIGRCPELRPNYIMLSGTGVQLWYVFGRQIPLLSKRSPRRDKYQAVLRMLYDRFEGELGAGICKVDAVCATISHAFRAPASPAKLGYPTRLFVYGGRNRAMCDPLAISDAVGGPLSPVDLEEWDQGGYEAYKERRAAARLAPASDKQRSYLSKLEAMGCVGPVPAELTVAGADRLIKAGEVEYTRRSQRHDGAGHIDTTAGHHVAVRHRDPKLYEYTLARIRIGDTPAGSRYNALVGLAGLAWNCGIPRKRAEVDMTALLDEPWAAEPGPNDGEPLRASDVADAMKSYNELGALRPREMLEKRLNWHYGPPAKRNGLPQAEHLRLARNRKFDLAEGGLKDGVLGGRPKGSTKDSTPKGERIRAYAAAHPGENHSQIARALGVSRPTVVKWLKDV